MDNFFYTIFYGKQASSSSNFVGPEGYKNLATAAQGLMAQAISANMRHLVPA
jgi:hypothetical protein